MNIVRWESDETPVSAQFDDPYYSRGDGQAESRYVFVEGNNLPSGWEGRSSFVVAELGFGTGLNFLETVAAWQATDPSRRPALTYVSFEMLPLTRQDLQRALSVWASLDQLASELVSHWPPASGWSSQEICGVRLELAIGDATALISTWNGVADAWYLDGFSPAKNPELWGKDLMHNVFERTKPEGTFSTFTAAGWVRRNLQGAGFLVEKFPGFGKKRECIRGRREG
ncbi:MAG: tRNA (5-methylaminomethyl-2-thiouridine)(34)-methyltransferase MnmD [Pseudomonadota bacterium]